MNELLWLFPILFMLHEMEEIIGFKIWLDKHLGIVQKYPLLSKIYNHFSHEGFAFAVLEQYLLCLVVTLFSIYYENYLIWIGFFIAFLIHLAIHILQSIIIRKYIPALATSIILLPIGLWILIQVISLSNYTHLAIIIWSIICFIIMILNLIFVHFLMRKITQKIKPTKFL